MPIFYKIKDDGQSVYVMKTLFGKAKKGQKNNIEAFKEISIDKFLSKIPENVRKKFEQDITRVKEISDMNLFSIIRFSIYDPEYNFNRTIYNVDGRGFQQDDSDIRECDQKEEAIKYCVAKYGKKFIEKYGYIFNDISDDSFSFANNEMISSAESNKLSNELSDLTKVNDLKEKIEEYSVKNKR